jgi:hypothetical protein
LNKLFKNNILDNLIKLDIYQLTEWIAELVQQRPAEIILVDTLETSGPLACILHGDYWINNMLFKYDDESQTQLGEKSPSIPVSLKMIDFQVSRIGHPLSDVLYFLYTSTKPETRQKYMPDLLRYYFDTLTTDLRLLGISLDDYSWEDFLADYKKRSLMWMFMGTIVLSAVLNKKAISNLQDLDAEEKLKGPTPSECLIFCFIFIWGVVNIKILFFKSNSETDVEPIKGEMGISLELEETMKTSMASYKLSDSPILSDRILKLMDEVKALNCC